MVIESFSKADVYAVHVYCKLAVRTATLLKSQNVNWL